MSLCAFVDGLPVFGSAIDDSLWAALRKGVRTKERVATLICGRRAFPFVSMRNRRFFRHGPEEERCLGEFCGAGVSEEHLDLQHEILAACVALGYEPSVSVRGDGWGCDYAALATRNLPQLKGDGWRADVLAVNASGGVYAFEVQLSRQTIERTQERDEKYEAAGVSRVWLFKKTPRGWRDSGVPIIRIGRANDRIWAWAGTPPGFYDLRNFVSLFARDVVTYREACGVRGHADTPHWCDPRIPPEEWIAAIVESGERLEEWKERKHAERHVHGTCSDCSGPLSEWDADHADYAQDRCYPCREGLR